MSLVRRFGAASLFFAVCVSAATLSLIGTAVASTYFYVQIFGAKQGFIDGGVTSKVHAKWIEASEFHHLVEVPTDPASGLPTGVPQHRSVIFTKTVDNASVNLWQALDTNEALTVVMEWEDWVSLTGAIVWRIQFDNARIVAIEPFQPIVHDTNSTNFHLHERVRLNYQTMTVVRPPSSGESATLSTVAVGK